MTAKPANRITPYLPACACRACALVARLEELDLPEPRRELEGTPALEAAPEAAPPVPGRWAAAVLIGLALFGALTLARKAVR